MNERIKQLAEEADLHATLYFRKEQLRKFAESIVLECMNECLRMQLGNQYTPEELLFQTKYRKIIKEHFGVEE